MSKSDVGIQDMTLNMNGWESNVCGRISSIHLHYLIHVG